MSNIINQTRSYERQAESGIVTHEHIPSTGLGPAQTTKSYPRKGFETRSAKDEMVREKMQFMDKDGMSPFGQVIATDSDFEWLRRKRETEAAAEYDAWIGTNFNVDDVTTRRWLQQVHPEYYDAREQDMIDRAKFALRVNLLKLRGPKNNKELILLWGLQTGRINLDRNWNVVGGAPDFDIAEEQKRFAGGLLTPARFKSDAQRRTAAEKPDNPFKTTREGASGMQFKNNFQLGVTDGKYPSFLSALNKYA